MKKTTFLFIVLAAVVLGSCKIETAAYHSYETECLGYSTDGHQTLRVWGTGKNRADAIKEAKKKAVNDVIFSGITAGNGDCDQKPLLIESNARKRNEDYFDNFFADGGAYDSFVTINNHRRSAKTRLVARGTREWGILVNVNRPALKKKLTDDGIIKK